MMKEQGRQTRPQARRKEVAQASSKNNDGNKKSKRDIDEFRAAYLCVKDSVGDELRNKRELAAALAFAGLHPPVSRIDSLWGAAESVTLAKFCDMVEVLDNEDQRFSAATPSNMATVFEQALGIQPGQQIDLEELALLLTTHGDRLTPEELKAAFSDAVVTPDGKLDYNEFCTRISATYVRTKKLSLEHLKTVDEKREQNSRTFVVRRGKRTSPDPSRMAKAESEKWPSRVMLKGCAFAEDDGSCTCHSYVLHVASPGKVRLEVSVDEIKSDVRACLFNARGKIVAFTLMKDDDELNSYWWEGSLTTGQYYLVPFTTCCWVPKSSPSPGREPQLIKKNANETVTLSDEFRGVLVDIFEQADLDQNGLLDREEFNLFNWRTSGEQVQDDEWAVLEDNFRLENGKLTLDGFIDLHQMEAEGNGGDPRELWLTLFSLGYNKQLQRTRSVSFLMTAKSPRENTLRLVPGVFRDCSAHGEIATAVATYLVDIESADSCALPIPCKTTGKEIVVTLYKHLSPHFAAIIVSRGADSASKLSLQVDCRGSENCLSHRGQLVWKGLVPVPPSSDVRQLIVAHFLVPETEGKEWSIRCEIDVV